MIGNDISKKGVSLGGVEMKTSKNEPGWWLKVLYTLIFTSLHTLKLLPGST